MSDGRIPVVIGGTAGEGDAVLVEGGGPIPAGAAAARFTLAPGGHAIGCACCVPRSDAGRALGRLFLARARGEVAAFARVVVVASSDEGRAAVEAAVGGDVVASARFRMG
ncbi:MAG: hypothetical protein ACRYG6_11490 [Janthinobacterium lividum]